MTETTITIKSQESIGQGIFDLRASVEEIAGIALPGQFVSLYSGDLSRLLPRPISICDVEGDTLRLVYRRMGEGTREFSLLLPGEKIRVIGPLGNGYPAASRYQGKKAVLLGGGIGIPPLLFLAKELAAAGATVTAVLGYRDRETFLSEDFLPYARVLAATEDGSVGVKGNVLDVMREENIPGDVLFACGPAPMLRGVRGFSNEEKIPCFLSLEERMACGIGACLGCVCRTTETDEHSLVKNARVCRDGPVFPAEKIEL